MIKKVDLSIKSTKELTNDRDINDNGLVQKFIDNEVMRLSDPLVPLDISAGAMGGTLKRSAIPNTVVGSGLVKWKTPYAKRMYYNPQYNFQGAPNRGGMWFERMKSAHKKSILKGAQTLAGGK